MTDAFILETAHAWGFDFIDVKDLQQWIEANIEPKYQWYQWVNLLRRKYEQKHSNAIMRAEQERAQRYDPQIPRPKII